MVSEMRKSGRPEFASVTLRDVYSHPTITQLATLCGSRCNEPVASTASRPPAREVSRTRHFVAGLAQTVSLYFVFAVRGVQWLAPWLVYFLLVRTHSRFHSLLWAVAAEIAVLPVVTLIAVCAKWLLLGRVRAGSHPLWGRLLSPLVVRPDAGSRCAARPPRWNAVTPVRISTLRSPHRQRCAHCLGNARRLRCNHDRQRLKH
jgi:hypothetical protein